MIIKNILARSLAIIAAVGLAAQVLGIPAFAASQGLPPSSDLEKVVFIHYRSPHAAAQGPKSGSPCPDPSTCTDFRWPRTKWGSSPSPNYLVDASGSGLSGATVSTAIQLAIATWTAPTGGTPSVSGVSGSVDCATADQFGSGNEMCWRNLNSSGIIAETFVWYSRATKQIAQADIIFNNGPGFAWSYESLGACTSFTSCNTDNPSLTTFDVRDIATHEFGHYLALLDDLYGGRDDLLTMYGYSDTGEVHKDSLGKGDCLGITAAYGSSCP